MSSRIEIVKDRLFLYDKLSEIRDHFKGMEYITYPSAGRFDHKYKHFQALRYYLLLTCFDILGQTKEFKKFEEWLRWKEKKQEREDLYKRLEHLELNEKIQAVHKYYNDTYGMKVSFIHFIRKVLTIDDRYRLIYSIEIRRIRDKDGKRISSEEITDHEKKENFLLMVRNQFTHAGKSLASGSDGVKHKGYFEREISEGIFIDGELKFTFVDQYWEKRGEYTTIYRTLRWPEVIREILERTVKRLESEASASNC